jgi:Dual-action HEIGH metallo-peptidase
LEAAVAIGLTLKKSEVSLTKFIWGTLVTIFLAQGVQAQAKPTIDNLEESTNPHIRRYAYVLAAAIWQFQGPSNIYVCWENPDTKYATEMELVQKAIADTWQKVSKLEFTGWQKCSVKNHGIRILIDDSGPRTMKLGRQIDGKPNGMVLNFTFANWSPSCTSMRSYCITAIATHEFGHAIGFSHEQNRPDAPGECQDIRQGTNGDLLLTPYDPDSVMNYCNAHWNNDGKLSALDIDAVQQLYGKR